MTTIMENISIEERQQHPTSIMLMPEIASMQPCMQDLGQSVIHILARLFIILEEEKGEEVRKANTEDQLEYLWWNLLVQAQQQLLLYGFLMLAL